MKRILFLIVIFSILLVGFYASAQNLRELYENQTDINMASLDQIKTIEGLNENQAEAIYEWREIHGYFQSIYDLLKIPQVDLQTFDMVKYKVRIDIPDVDKSETYRRIAQLQARLASEDGGPTQIAIDEWEDLLLDPLNVNEASLDDILVLGRVTPIDAAAVINKRNSGSNIRDARSLRNTPGLSNYGYQNMRDYVAYKPSDNEWKFHGNLRLTWDYQNRLDDDEYNPEEQISALTSQINELDLTSADTTNLGNTLIRYNNWSAADVDSLRNILLKEQKELAGYKPTGRMVQKFRARLGNKLKTGLIFEKDEGEYKYTDLRKGFLSLSNFGNEMYQMKNFIIGNYRIAFGQGLIMDNADERRDRTTDRIVGLFGDATTTEEFSLFGVATENKIWRFQNIFFYSTDKKDAILNPDGSVNSMIVTDYQLSTMKDKLKEETYGANIRLDLSNLSLIPTGSYIGFTGYQSSYDRDFNPIPETLDIPGAPADGNYNQLVDKNYTELWSGDKRTVLGGEFRTVFDNFSLEGEFAKLQDADDGKAYILKARTLYEHIYLLAVFRHYALDYDNPYSRSFAEQGKFDDTLLEKDYRLTDPLYSQLQNFPTPKAEEGIYLETRYQITRKLTLTKLYADMWKNLAYNLPNLRVQGELEYRPIWPLRFRFKHKYQNKQRGRSIEPSRSVTNETTLRVFALVTQRDFFQLQFRYGKVDLTSIPSLVGESVGSDLEIAVPRDIAMDGGFIESSWDHNFSPNLSVEGGIMFWNTNGMSQWNFEDNGIDFMEGRGRKYYVVISDRFSPNVQLRLKFRNKYTEYPHTGLSWIGDDFVYESSNPIEAYTKNQLMQKRNIFSLEVQFDYRW